MPKSVVCPVWPSFDANPKVERGLNRPCPVGQSCHTLFPHRNLTNLRQWSEARRSQSPSVAPDQLTAFCILQASRRQQQALMMLCHRIHGGGVGPPGTRGAGWQLRAACCSGRWQPPACQVATLYTATSLPSQVATLQLALQPTGVQPPPLSHATLADVCTQAQECELSLAERASSSETVQLWSRRKRFFCS